MRKLVNKLLARPAIPISLVVMLLVGTSSVIFYVERRLSEIEEALPITLSKQERDARVLVSDMGTLVQSIGIARTNQAPGNFSIVLRQIDDIKQYLEIIRENYKFNDVLGVSAIHAKLNPAIFDINNWLTDGIYNFEPTSAQTLKMAELRAKEAHEEAEILLLKVGKTAIDVLTAQADRIDAFRNIMILTLAVLTIMTVGLVHARISFAKERVGAERQRGADSLPGQLRFADRPAESFKFR